MIVVKELQDAITCQGIGNARNPGFNNGVPFANNLPNGLPGPGLGGFGLGGSGIAGPGLLGAGLGGPGLGGPGLGSPGLLGNQGLAGCGRASGGGFAVTSTSPIAPTGVSILAENLAIEGPLSVGGQLPFLGTVGIEGALPASGSGTVSYGCGNGNVGITSDLGGYGAAGQYGTGASQYGPGLAGYGAGLAGYNPGLVGAGLNAPGLVGPGFGGNGLAGGFTHPGGSGIAIAALK